MPKGRRNERARFGTYLDPAGLQRHIRRSANRREECTALAGQARSIAGIPRRKAGRSCPTRRYTRRKRARQHAPAGTALLEVRRNLPAAQRHRKTARNGIASSSSGSKPTPKPVSWSWTSPTRHIPGSPLRTRAHLRLGGLRQAEAVPVARGVLKDSPVANLVAANRGGPDRRACQGWF